MKSRCDCKQIMKDKGNIEQLLHLEALICCLGSKKLKEGMKYGEFDAYLTEILKEIIPNWPKDSRIWCMKDTHSHVMCIVDGNILPSYLIYNSSAELPKIIDKLREEVKK